ncbi:hypothetical protein [Microbacterium shaanxiense]
MSMTTHASPGVFPAIAVRDTVMPLDWRWPLHLLYSFQVAPLTRAAKMGLWRSW